MGPPAGDKKAPRLFLPACIAGRLSEFRPKPAWLAPYSFPQKIRLKERMETLEKKISGYEQLELLLTSTGSQLVSAVGLALERFGFKVRIAENQGHHDVKLRHGDYQAVLSRVFLAVGQDTARRLGWSGRILDTSRLK